MLLLLVLVAILLYRSLGNFFAPLYDPDAKQRAVTPRGDLAQDEQATIAIYKQASKSVVHVVTLAVHRDAITRNLFELPSGTGSGFVWNKKGHIVTNYHVIRNAQAARVLLDDQTVWDARLVGFAPDKDLAVLKIDAPASKLYPIPIGTSKDLQVGQKAYAIGNPFGFDHSLTTGVISGLDREIESVTRRPIEGVIQTDAAINPGNSGGPLLDSAGRLIGINTAIYSPSGAYAGVGFAVPVDTVNENVPQLIRNGKVDRPGLGIYINVDVADVEGVLVDGVSKNGPAAAAGLKPTERDRRGRIRKLGDIIVGMDEHEITSPEDLYKALGRYKVGETVTLKVLRDGELHQLKLTLEPLATMSQK
jgi:S1-C subfamily serine protease